MSYICSTTTTTNAKLMISYISTTLTAAQLANLVSKVTEAVNNSVLEIEAEISGWESDCHKADIEIEHDIEGIFLINVEAEIYYLGGEERSRDALVTVINDEGEALKFSKDDQAKFNRLATEKLQLI